MADDPTLLSYQLTYEIRVFDLMTSSQQANDYYLACMYGEALLEFLESDLPQKPIAKNDKEKRAEPIMYYEVLFKTVMKKVKFNVNYIRSTYGTRVEIPTMVKDQKRNN